MVSAPQHVRRRPTRTWTQRFALFVGVVLVVGCLCMASAIGYVYWKTGTFARANVTLDRQKDPLAPRNYLIIGSDSRANVDASDPNADLFLGAGEPTGQRSDTILLMRVDPIVGDVQLLSFPRDLWVPIAGTNTSAKINSAYGQGKQVLVDTIRQEFDVPINNYIEVDFSGFKDLVNAIGGVNLYFPTAMKDDHTGLDVENPGCVTLDGDQGLAFARSRYTQYRRANGSWSDTDPIADLGRIQRQQVFVRKAMKKITSLNITDVPTALSLLDVATKSVTLDQTISNSDLIDLAKRFKAIQDQDIKTLSLPNLKGATSSDGQSILTYDKKAAQSVLNIFRGVPPGTVLEPDVTVDVENGSGVKDEARDLVQAFSEVGFSKGSIGPDVKQPQPATTLHHAIGEEAAADLVARHMTSPVQLVADRAIAPGHVLVITAPDFTTLMQTPRAPTTTTTVPPTTAPLAPGVTTTTVAPTTTTTTTDPYVPGTPPDGVVC
jgi:polyisoprenyl-teichoic acid--peptidoglycan teichoic acid transferase